MSLRKSIKFVANIIPGCNVKLVLLAYYENLEENIRDLALECLFTKIKMMEILNASFNTKISDAYTMMVKYFCFFYVKWLSNSKTF